MSSSTLEFDLSKKIPYLLDGEPFFTMISRRVSKRTNYNVPTLGVRLDPRGNYILEYNPKYLAQYADQLNILRALVFHEFYHIILFHLADRAPWHGLDDEEKIAMMIEKKERWNFATDLAINSHLKALHGGNWLVPGETMFQNFPKFMTSEWYYEYLPELPKQQCGNGNAQGGRGHGMGEDCHPWADPEEVKRMIESGEMPEASYVQNATKSMIREAALEAGKKNWGTVHAEMQEYILSIIGMGKVNWQAIIRNFVTGVVRGIPRSTVRKVNRRIPHVLPWGRSIRREAMIAVSVDQSGSVSDELLEEFFAEIKSLSKLATIVVVPFDSEVFEDCVFTWSKKTTNAAKSRIERVGCGGTSFQAPTQYVNERKKFDGHIVLTDMYAPKPEVSRCRRIWCVPAETAKNPYFETTEMVVGIE